MSGAAVGCPGEVVRRRFSPRHDGDGIMSAAIAMPGNTAATFLTHFFGSGLADDTNVVERFRAMLDGDIRLCPDEAPAAKKGRREAKYPTASRIKRRGGSDPPGSPASIPPSLIHRESCFRPAGAGFGLTPHEHTCGAGVWDGAVRLSGQRRAGHRVWSDRQSRAAPCAGRQACPGPPSRRQIRQGA